MINGHIENIFVQELPAITVQRLTKSFGDRPVLRDLDLNLHLGEVFVLFGANGSGKTTLIRSLGTLAKADKGIIRIMGRDLRRRGAFLRRFIGVLTHQTFLYDELTGQENLRFYGQMFGLRNVNERIRSLTEKMGLQRVLDKRVGTLSHGMQKRLSIVRAVLHDPTILLLDEPESGLDEEALSLLGHLLSGEDKGKRAVIITTHNLGYGFGLADHVGILANGHIAYQQDRGSLDMEAFRDIYTGYLSKAPK